MPGYKIVLITLLLLFSCSEKENSTTTPDAESFFKVYSTFLQLSRADSIMTDESVLMDSHPDVFLEAFEKFDAALRTDSTKN